MKYILCLFLVFPLYVFGQLDVVIKNDSLLEKKGEIPVTDEVIMERIINAPRITEEFETNGKIVLSVCVNNHGEVMKANLFREQSIDYTEELIRIARNNAFKYKFSKSDLIEQCGTITYVFKLKNEKEKN